EAPTQGTEAPTQGTEAPTQGTEAPTQGTEAPTQGTEAPTVKPTQPSNPATGDNSHLVVWMGLMAAATAAFVSIFVFGKKKIAR
ncbi:MAG: LPXTG cell wall anchor domain-containing protein, partial [Oscillospiraceae bacterium]|nr:LPXTG cell wall anchor domain-containing protein [Oscillospiraceae bacterium]